MVSYIREGNVWCYLDIVPVNQTTNGRVYTKIPVLWPQTGGEPWRHSYISDVIEHRERCEVKEALTSMSDDVLAGGQLVTQLGGEGS